MAHILLLATGEVPATWRRRSRKRGKERGKTVLEGGGAGRPLARAQLEILAHAHWSGKSWAPLPGRQWAMPRATICDDRPAVDALALELMRPRRAAAAR